MSGFVIFAFPKAGGFKKAETVRGVGDKAPVNPIDVFGCFGKTNLKPPLPKGGGSCTAADGGIHHFQK